jgi:hypothetical protein
VNQVWRNGSPTYDDQVSNGVGGYRVTRILLEHPWVLCGACALATMGVSAMFFITNSPGPSYNTYEYRESEGSAGLYFLPALFGGISGVAGVIMLVVTVSLFIGDVRSRIRRREERSLPPVQ